MKIIMLKFRWKFLLVCHHSETQPTMTNTAGIILPMKRVGARQAALLREASSASVRARVKHLVDKPSKLCLEARPFDLQSIQHTQYCQVLEEIRGMDWLSGAPHLFRAFLPFPLQLWYTTVTFFSCIALHGKKKQTVQAWLLSEGDVDHTCDKTNTFLYLTFFNFGEQKYKQVPLLE